MVSYILGGGIAGLVFAFYNDDYTIITDNVGGQFSAPFQLGPRYFHETENAKRFLRDLDFRNVTIKLVRVGYVDDSGFVDAPDAEFSKRYFMKSRGEQNLANFERVVMNNGVKEFCALNADFAEIVSRLSAILKDRIMIAKVLRVDTLLRCITISDNGESAKCIDYDSLISTIPLNVFCKLSNVECERLKSVSMTYCLAGRSAFDMKAFDFVYDCGQSTQFHRISADSAGVVFDFLESRAVDTSAFKNAITLKNAQIMSLKSVPVIDCVTFAGRYGTWNRKWKTEVVIDEAIKHREQKKLGRPA